MLAASVLAPLRKHHAAPPQAPRLAAVPAGERVYAVGDIHGRLDLLKNLMAMIEADARTHQAARTALVFLGDYIDRGPFSRDVVDFLLHGLPASMRPVFLRGNHEEFLLRILGGEEALAAGWLRYGGGDTLLSYGIRPPAPHLRQSLCAAMREKIPAAHRAFFDATRLSYVCGDYLFVHAGIRPGVAIEAQAKGDLLEIREEFLRAEALHPKVVIHGHSISPAPDLRANRIGIDTGAFATGHLTCLALEGTDRRFLMT